MDFQMDHHEDFLDPGRDSIWVIIGQVIFVCIIMNFYFIFLSFSTKEALIEVQNERKELKQKLDQVLTETQNQQLRMSAELEDLGQTKVYLEERLIELIRSVYRLHFRVNLFFLTLKTRVFHCLWLASVFHDYRLGFNFIQFS